LERKSTNILHFVRWWTLTVGTIVYIYYFVANHQKHFNKPVLISLRLRCFVCLVYLISQFFLVFPLHCQVCFVTNNGQLSLGIRIRWHGCCTTRTSTTTMCMIGLYRWCNGFGIPRKSCIGLSLYQKQDGM
jgi:hypothetical protein